MKIKAAFILKKVAGKYIVVPTLEAAINFNGIMTLNETGVFLFKQMSEHTTVERLIDQIVDVYDIDFTNAKADVLAFVAKLKEKGIVDEQ